MSDELDRCSIDAMHWAEQFCETLRRNDWAVDDIDEGLMVGWFSNYWAAVNDPLQKRIDELADQTRLLQKLCALLDRIEREEDSEIVMQRFDIFKEHGTVIWGHEISGRTQ